MTTFSTVILPSQKKKDGMQPIKIRVAHNRETRYINTGIEVEKNHFKDGRIVRRSDKNLLNAKLNGIYQKYYGRFLELEFADSLSCSELINRITNGTDVQRITMSEAVGNLLAERELAQPTRDHYKYFLRYFEKSAGKNFRVSLLTRSVVLKFLSVTGKSCNQTTTRIYLHKFKSVVNYCVNILGLRLSSNPFACVETPKSLKRDTALTIDEMRRVRDVRLTRRAEFCRDIFLLSYYLGGMNLKDIGITRFNSPILSYARAKTARKNNGDVVSFTIQPEAQEIIDRYKSSDGIIRFGCLNLNNSVNKYLRDIAAMTGIKHRVTFYSARKSFAQHAYDLGVPLSTIEYCMGQKMKEDRPIFAYVKVMKKHADNCIRLVLDNLKN